MPFIPTIDIQESSRVMTDTFMGYNHRLKIQDGEFFDDTNLTTEFYPMLAPRRKRGTVMPLTAPGGLLEKDALAYVDNGTLYYNFTATPVTNLSAGEKQLVSMGSYICIFPDKVYYNTANASDYGSMEAHWTYTGDVEYVMCHQDGTPYESVARQETEPDSASTELWIKTYSGTSSTTVYYYSQTEMVWVELNTVYARLNFGSYGVIPGLFKEYDAVTISGSNYDDVNGSKIIYAVGGVDSDVEEERVQDYIVVIYPLGQQSIVWEDETISIDRNVPALDFVCEAQNRLWGCRYGYDSDLGATLNEIYCCALGDFKNWSQYLGISTDSWTGSVGTDGPWTGCINFYGTPLFFKENFMHQVGISSQGAHQITATPCRGVQKGSHKSLAIVNETLFYKARTGVCAYQGSFPSSVSDALGDLLYYDAVAGAFGERYYICVKDAANEWQLFVYDTQKGLWMHEDASHFTSFAKVDDYLYAIQTNGSAYSLTELNGKTGTLEGKVHWKAESGILYYLYPDNKYVTRYNFRLKGDRDTVIHAFVEYDSSGIWEPKGDIRLNGINTVTLPIRPHRCDHMRLKLEGEGDCRIFSIARILEVGSDM